MRKRTEPERTCVGCRGRAAKGSLVRLARRTDGTVMLDPQGRVPGRGAYLHPDRECAETAMTRGGLARALRTGLQPEEAARLRADIEREVGQ
ncbi:MAG TPA: YlxR family protein [Actinomycetota bacterium]